jgi:hypothetical protein
MKERLAWQVGDVARLKKPHACGGFDWQVQRVGMDMRLECMQCGHEIMLTRQEFDKRVKARIERPGGQKKLETD